MPPPPLLWTESILLYFLLNDDMNWVLVVVVGMEHINKSLGGKGGVGEHSKVSVSSEGRLLLGVLSLLECNGCACLGGKDGGSTSSNTSSVGRGSSLGLGGRHGIVSLILLFRSLFITRLSLFSGLYDSSPWSG